MRSNLLLTTAAAALLGLYATGAKATAVITFDTATTGALSGSYTEAGFTYSVAYGSLEIDASGNPGNDLATTMPGAFQSNDALLDIVSSTPGDQFTFQSLDLDGSGIEVIGLLNGKQVGQDSFYPTESGWATYAANKLAGITVDTLEVGLSALNWAGYTSQNAIDNITLAPAGGSTTSAPEPASIALLGVGLAGIGGFRRRRKSA